MRLGIFFQRAVFWARHPPNRTGGAATLELIARLNPAKVPRRPRG